MDNDQEQKPKTTYDVILEGFRIIASFNYRSSGVVVHPILDALKARIQLGLRRNEIISMDELVQCGYATWPPWFWLDYSRVMHKKVKENFLKVGARYMVFEVVQELYDADKETAPYIIMRDGKEVVLPLECFSEADEADYRGALERLKRRALN